MSSRRQLEAYETSESDSEDIETGEHVEENTRKKNINWISWKDFETEKAAIDCLAEEKYSRAFMNKGSEATGRSEATDYRRFKLKIFYLYNFSNEIIQFSRFYCTT